MNCVYVLKSLKDGNRYIGSTNDLKRRLREHDEGKVFSTKNRRPLKLIYYQEFGNLIEARIYESKYKKSRGIFNKAVSDGILINNGD